mmetsp:Transcript_25674/g.56314  ORF Transcript_25674/g.56314 Transcript_25674/m.56314 type:complete len:210 (-) Transcript_25674:182-811(-)
MRRIAKTKIAILKAPLITMRPAYKGCLYHSCWPLPNFAMLLPSSSDIWPPRASSPSPPSSTRADSKSISSMLAAIFARDRESSLSLLIVPSGCSPSRTSFTSGSSVGAGRAGFPQQSKVDNTLSTALSAAAATVPPLVSSGVVSTTTFWAASSSWVFTAATFFLWAKAWSRFPGTRPQGSHTLSIKSVFPCGLSSPAGFPASTGACPSS